MSSIKIRKMSMQNNENSTLQATPQFHMKADDRRPLEGLPWQVPLAEWPEHGVVPLSIRKGESRHPVIFVERAGSRYAIKETTPRMAEREINNLREVERRGIPALSPVGSVTVREAPVLLEEPGPGGIPQYISGDRGYTVTRLASRVVPHALLYRIPFTRRNKQRIWSAVAVLMIELHEHGVYWGDPSLANVLVRIDGRRILAIMADAETAELFPGTISEGLREQDLALFNESLLWQAEDLRTARGLPEEEEIMGEADFRYFERRYRWLRREHARLATSSSLITFFQVEGLLHDLNRWGFSLLDTGGHALQEFVTILPGWHLRRIQELLGITVPRPYARRFYNTILGHQAIMSNSEKRHVSIEEAARDWYTRYHLPTILLLRQNLTRGQDPMRAYFSLLRHKLDLSVKAGYEIPLDEAALSWSMQQAETGELGSIDPAMLAKWWHELEPVSQVLEPPMIESQMLEPLLSKPEQPLVHLPTPELEHELNQMLDQGEAED
jgi:Domain of unknown function (DUF4032)